jgi:hypothetical protein
MNVFIYQNFIQPLKNSGSEQYLISKLKSVNNVQISVDKESSNYDCFISFNIEPLNKQESLRRGTMFDIERLSVSVKQSINSGKMSKEDELGRTKDIESMLLHKTKKVSLCCCPNMFTKRFESGDYEGPILFERRIKYATFTAFFLQVGMTFIALFFMGGGSIQDSYDE